jgi:hypothetical protein
MRNVVKGFEFSQMAVPKAHAANINAAFNSHHGPKLGSSRLLHVPAAKHPKIASRPGKNVGVRGGYKV